MQLKIKQLKQNNKIFVPQTTAEAVLVNHESQVLPLHLVLKRKVETVETPEDSGLSVKQEGVKIVIDHINKITPNEKASPLLIKHDHRGHIVETAPMGKLTVLVNNTKHIEADGSSDQTLNMGDDFTTDNQIIKLKWTEINGNS